MLRSAVEPRSAAAHALLTVKSVDFKLKVIPIPEYASFMVAIWLLIMVCEYLPCFAEVVTTWTYTGTFRDATRLISWLAAPILAASASSATTSAAGFSRAQRVYSALTKVAADAARAREANFMLAE
jgi:hypothetical protein